MNELLLIHYHGFKNYVYNHNKNLALRIPYLSMDSKRKALKKL